MNVDMIFWLICAGLVIGAAYNLIGIRCSEPVTAWLVGYEESRHFDPETGTETGGMIPVYRYEWKGTQKTYRSVIGIPGFARKKEKHTLYVRKDGKVFETETTVSLLVSALLLLLIGQLG